PSTCLAPLSLHDALPIFSHGAHRHDEHVLVRRLAEHIHAVFCASHSVDLTADVAFGETHNRRGVLHLHGLTELLAETCRVPWRTDRKSTRLNSSHVKISY